MDIIDIMLARAMTPQGATETYVAIANAAAEKAEKAEQDAAAAIATVEAAADEIAAAKEEADDLLEAAQDALETAQQAQLNIPDTEDIDAEVKKMTVNTAVIDGQNAKTLQVISTYPDNTLNTQNITKLYKSTGNNEDGTMTQKAITNALSSKVDTTTLNNYATVTYVTQQIANIPAGGGGSGSSSTINFSADDAGRIVIIDENGNLIPGNIDESEMIEALLQTGLYTLKNAVGLDMDYSNKTMKRIQSAVNLEMGTDFNKFSMYGGRMRCNVADDGTINAFYGDDSYRDDGSNGQVMVYQPKFYYQRKPLDVTNLTKGQAIRHDSLILSATKQPGFKVAPIFDTSDGELDYVLFSAYEGSITNDKLTSVANTTLTDNVSIAAFEAAANARGNGWHIMNMAAESANQMLEIVEFGQMNVQAALEDGISYNPVNGAHCLYITGSTAALGNTTGHATSTQVSINGTVSTQTEVGKRAISYRGMENPWGNMWKMIGGINIKGDGQSLGGAPYICTDFNYTPGIISNNYEDVGFNLSALQGWISAMGYGNSKYDWVFLPVECSSVANSLLPVGDNLWVIAHTNENKILAVGGSYNSGDDNGAFYYAADRNVNDSIRNNFSARLMYIPTKNSTYTANISKWTTKMGG